LEARLSELHDLARKHTCQITELITTQDSIAQSLQALGFKITAHIGSD
jgi:DNA repair ATPase RecN